jgi:hypothetical protein
MGNFFDKSKNKMKDKGRKKTKGKIYRLWEMTNRIIKYIDD